MNFIETLASKLTSKPKIVFPEGANSKIIEAATLAEQRGVCQPILLTSGDSLTTAAQMVADGTADAMVAGIDHTTRDVILTTRDVIGMSDGIKTFSSIFIIDLPDGRTFALSDAGVCKNPTATQLADITISTAQTAQLVFDTPPKIAFLSFSTHGSGGQDPSIDKIHETIPLARRALASDIIIDGELQLDAAINPEISAKKSPDSPLKGAANVLIVPDLNVGNILYKSLEQFAAAKAYGPILQGFKRPVSDLSRGSTTDDIYGVAVITAILAQSSIDK